MMRPILIRVPEEDYPYYKEYADSKDWSMAELFRESAKKEIGLKKKKAKKKYSIWDLGTKLVFNSGLKDASVNTDKYYYEFEEKKWRK